MPYISVPLPFDERSWNRVGIRIDVVIWMRLGHSQSYVYASRVQMRLTPHRDGNVEHVVHNHLP